MTNFTKMLKEGTPDQLRSARELRYKLADVCMANYETDTEQKGRSIYSALSHLALIPELEINMAHYDNLMFVDNALLQPEVAYYVRAKMRELEDLINT